MAESYFRDQKVWITGASSGIGKALAIALAAEGANLVLSSRKREVLKALESELMQRGAKSVQSIAFDLEIEAEVNTAIAKLKTIWEAPDILILSGGLSQRSLISETNIAVYRRLMEVDYLANVNLSKAFIDTWEKQGSGQVVVISSLVGKIPTPYRSGYAAAKHALHGFFETLRAEHKSIAVSIICPGFIHTQVSVNALTGDNSALGEMDRAQAEGMPAEKFALKALKVIRRKKPEALIGGKEVAGVYLNRRFPQVFRWLIRRARVR